MKRILAGLVLALFTAVAFAQLNPFTPNTAQSTTVSVTTSSATTTLPTTVAFATNIELQNVGANTVFVEFGTSSVTAAVATGYPILSGQSKIITVPNTTTSIAAITGTSTSTLYVSIGKGQ